MKQKPFVSGIGAPFFLICSLFLVFLPNSPLHAQDVDLSVTKGAYPTPAIVAEPLTYTLEVTVPPPGAMGLRVTDTIVASGGITLTNIYTPPEWMFGVISGTVPSGTLHRILFTYPSAMTTTITLTIPLTIATVPSMAGLITNTAQVASDSFDPEPGNNSFTRVIRAIFGERLAAPVPTLGHWGILIMVVLVGTGGVFFIRRKRMP